MTNPNQRGTGAFGLGNDLLASASGGQHRDQIDSKVNWNATSKLNVFVRFGFNNNNWITPQPFGVLGGPSLSSTNTAVGNGFGHIFNDTISGTYVFTPHVLMDVSFGYSRNDNSTRQINEDQNFGDTLLHIPGLSNAGLPAQLMKFLNGMPQFNIDGFANIGGIPNAFEPYDYSDAERDYVANVNWLKGSHDLRAGVDWDRQGVNEWQAMGIGGGNTYSTAAGGFHFTQGTTQLNGGPAGNDFNAFASFLLGAAANAGRIRISSEFIRVVFGHEPDARPGIRRICSGPLAGVAQADGDLRRPLGGLRASESRRRSGTGVSRSPKQCHGDLWLGLGSRELRDHQRQGAIRASSGIAYRVSDSFVIRAGAGLANDPTSSLVQLRLNGPYVFTQLLSPANSFGYATTLSQGIPVVPTPNLNNPTVPWPGNANTLSLNNANWVRGYIETWNLTLEKRIKGWTASVGYAGTRAVDPRDQLEAKLGNYRHGRRGAAICGIWPDRVEPSLWHGRYYEIRCSPGSSDACVLLRISARYQLYI